MSHPMPSPDAASSLPDILLVHGSCHGAWCWRDLIPALMARGMTARALDLPSHGADTTPYSEVTLDSYRDAILHNIISRPQKPVVLLGHSAGGFSITAAAEIAAQKAPGAVAGLIYLCAYVPEGGTSLGDQRRAADQHPILDMITRTKDRKAFTFKADAGTEALFHDCPPDVPEFARAHMGPQAIAPQETPLTTTEASRSLPRHYILCENDRVIPPEAQRKMTSGWPASTVHRLPSGHSPYFSMPGRLADVIERALRTL